MKVGVTEHTFEDSVLMRNAITRYHLPESTVNTDVLALKTFYHVTNLLCLLLFFLFSKLL